MIAVDNCHFSIIEEILNDRLGFCVCVCVCVCLFVDLFLNLFILLLYREEEVLEKDNAGSPVVAYGLHSQWSEILPLLEVIIIIIFH